MFIIQKKMVILQSLRHKNYHNINIYIVSRNIIELIYLIDFIVYNLKLV